MQIRRTAAALTSAAALSVTGVAMAAPASAAPNTAVQDGLVNLALQDTTVQVPIAIAANICGVAVNLLVTTPVGLPVDCTATGVADATRQGGGGADNARQSGLVNVAIQDTTVQIPVAVAANVCGVAVNIITTTPVTGPVTCDAFADSDAGA